MSDKNKVSIYQGYIIGHDKYGYFCRACNIDGAKNRVSIEREIDKKIEFWARLSKGIRNKE